MPLTQNTNRIETPLSVKLMNGYIEQLDRFGPTIMKATRDYGEVWLSAAGLMRKTIIGAAERSGRKIPLAHTLADAANAAVSMACTVQYAAIDAMIKTHRQAIASACDIMSGKETA
jgi:hypothetical protein